MGACFETVTIKAKNEIELRDKFAQMQRDLCYQYGHDTYAGHMGIVEGLEVRHKTFTTRREAVEWLDNNCEKWREAIAVKVGPGEWLVGAVCPE